MTREGRPPRLERSRRSSGMLAVNQRSKPSIRVWLQLRVHARLALITHCTDSEMASSSLTRPRLANSAIARQHPCHRASPRTDSAPPNPIVPPADAVPPGSTMTPNAVSMTGSSSVPANRLIVAMTICSAKEGGKRADKRARYFAQE